MKTISESVALDKLSALVIDEQRIIRDAIKHELFFCGVAYTRGAANAFEAIQACEQKKFDLILISFNLSTDKDGFHLLEELKSKGYISHLTTVIFLSADTSNLLVNCVVEMQPDDFWTKPLKTKKIRERLHNIVEQRKVLRRPLISADRQDYSRAIYYAERVIKMGKAEKHHPKLYRLIGQCIFNLREYQEAEKFFRELAQKYDFGWVQIGLLKARLKQNKLAEVEPQIEELRMREDTKFAVHDLLSNHHIEHQNYADAYNEIKITSALAPRNIERNRRLRDLARINHDNEGQYISTLNMLRHAKNSIHDSPDLTLQVIRAGIDLAMTTNDFRRLELRRELSKRLSDVRSGQYGSKLKNQIKVLEARMSNLDGNKYAADSMLCDIEQISNAQNIEDSLDLMKAFHESGNREKAADTLRSLKLNYNEHSAKSVVMSAYLEQELKERAQIHFSPKELVEMSAEYYKSKRYHPAYNCLKQAFVLSPSNSTVALGLLKVLTMLKKSGFCFQHDEQNIIESCNLLLSTAELPDEKKSELATYRDNLELEQCTVTP